MVYFMENHIKMEDDWGYPYFRNPPLSLQMPSLTMWDLIEIRAILTFDIICWLNVSTSEEAMKMDRNHGRLGMWKASLFLQ